MNHRIRKIQSLIEALDNAIEQVNLLLINANNNNCKHDHIGVLNETFKMLKNIKADTSRILLCLFLDKYFAENNFKKLDNKMSSQK